MGGGGGAWGLKKASIAVAVVTDLDRFGRALGVRLLFLGGLRVDGLLQT